jgi:superfamily II DNA or RNA helicase
MKLLIDHTWTSIVGKYPENAFDQILLYRVDKPWFAKSFQKGHWDGSKSYMNKRGKLHKFPSGFLLDITKQLDLMGWEYEIEDKRVYPDLTIEPATKLFNDDDTDTPTLDLTAPPYDYQAEVVQTALTHGRGIIRGATGMGKSECGAGIIASYGMPKTLWLTHRKTLLHQSRARLQRRLREDIGILGDGQRDLKNITVAMIQSLDHNAADQELWDFQQSCQLVILDEVHHLESEQWYRTLCRIPAAYRFGLTATPNMEKQGLALKALTGRIIVNIGPQELIQRVVLVPPRIWIQPINGPVIDKKLKGKEVYGPGIIRNPFRNSSIVDAVKTFKLEKKPTLILVRFIEHGQALREQLSDAGLDTDFIRGSMPEAKRDLVLAGLKNGLLDAVIAQVEIMAEGVDLPWLRAIILAHGGSGGGKAGNAEAKRQTVQILGRGMRRYPGKSYVDILDFADSTHKSLKQASLERLQTYIDEGYESQIGYWCDR